MFPSELGSVVSRLYFLACFVIGESTTLDFGSCLLGYMGLNSTSGFLSLDYKLDEGIHLTFLSAWLTLIKYLED